MQVLHQGTEHLSVFCTVDGFNVCTKNFYPEFIKDAVFCQFHNKVQTCLTTKGAENRIRSFLEDDSFGRVKCQRFYIDTVCDGGVCHDGSRIGVDQNDFISFLTQCCAGLRTCIVEFSCLTNDNRTGTYDHDLMYILTLRHLLSPLPLMQ